MGQALTIASSGLFALGLLAAPLLAGGQELAIGHLETSDDSGGINWLFFHCQQSDPVLRCAIFQTLIMRESGNCTVVNDYSEATFNWNNVTQTWILQEGPTGPCGRISIGTLERDRDTPKYWKYTERKINTKSDGVLPGGLSCKKIPDTTLQYTWRASTNRAGCSTLKNLMN